MWVDPARNHQVACRIDYQGSAAGLQSRTDLCDDLADDTNVCVPRSVGIHYATAPNENLPVAASLWLNGLGRPGPEPNASREQCAKQIPSTR
jgi:hypothetical protein